MTEAPARLRDEGGQALAELALALPLLLILVTAIAQLGVAYHRSLLLADAVRDGARVAAVSRSVPDPAGAATAAVVRSAPGLDASELRSGTTVTSTWEAGADVTVEATYPYRIDVFGLPVYAGRLESSTTERVE